jgi:hypothetical protein
MTVRGLHRGSRQYTLGSAPAGLALRHDSARGFDLAGRARSGLGHHRGNSSTRHRQNGSGSWSTTLIADPKVAGGNRINRAAFIVPATPRQGDRGRNVLRGFGARQVDLTLRRQIGLPERLSL